MKNKANKCFILVKARIWHLCNNCLCKDKQQCVLLQQNKADYVKRNIQSPNGD